MESSKIGAVSVYALGGLCEVGKNTYCIESESSLIIIDAGVRFPGTDLPGVNYLIPDYTKLKSAQQKIKALFITHGHEDHIGGIPFLIQTLTIPVIYAPRLAAALIKHKLQELRINEPVNIVEYDDDTIVNLGDFKVSFFHVTHSIPDSYGIVVDTPQGRIMHTGDFKIDLTPVDKPFDLSKVAIYGNEGVDLLLSDSTNAEIEGYTPSEKHVLESIKEIFRNTPGRLILSTFSSNISRIQQIVEVAVEHNRKIAIIGRSMENVVQLARDFGYIKIPDTSIIPIENVREYPNSQLCILCTGSQGEPMAALSRIANGEHKDLFIVPGDTVVFSSSAIPGNGILIENVVNMLVKKGAEVLTNSVLYAVHSSGHPSKQELRLMLRLAHPKYFMPIHGDYRMLKLHGKIAEEIGINKRNIFILENGDSIVLSNHTIKPGAKYPAGVIMIDGKDLNGANANIIRDREKLKNNGMIAVVVGIDSKNHVITKNPQLVSYAFISGSEWNISRAEEITRLEIEKLLKENTSFNEIKNTIKDVVSTYVERKTQLEPMVIPVVMDVAE